VTEVARPLPRPTALSRPFWEGCQEARLLVQRCGDCGEHVFIPQEFCPRCLGTDLAWIESAGRGAIVTYTVVGRAQTPAFTTPYVVAVVRLDEGYEMLSNVVDAELDDIRIGARVEVLFAEQSSEIALPCFRLAPDPHTPPTTERSSAC
jgi:uncharacterized OB-fold protein